MNRKNLLLVLFLMLLAPAAQAGVGISAGCSGSAMDLNVVVFNDEFPAEWTGLVVQRSLLGLCDSETIITAEPLPIPEEHFTEVFYPLSDAEVEAGLFYVYTVFAINEAGDLLPVWGMGSPPLTALAACGQAVATRGQVVVQSYEYLEMRINECTDSCWLGCGGMGILSLTEEQFNALLPYAASQVPVDIYGTFAYSGMPTYYCLEEITGWQPSPAGQCGPVPVQPSTWGSLKARYR